ncbi:MAG: IclR family transcriptional regulator [Streptosporangiaceae bacterium]
MAGSAPDRVGSKSVLERVFALLDSFTPEEPELTLAELASRTGIPKSTVHRLAKLLVEQRLLKRTAAGFSLGLRLFELGELVGDRRELRDVSLPVLQELFEQTHEVIHLGALEGTEVLYFLKIVGYKVFPLPTRAGGRWPVHASALGKVLLAFGAADPQSILAASGMKPLTPYTIVDPRRLLQQLTVVRSEGVAFEHQESVLGNSCVAAPVFGTARHPVAAVSLSGPPLRLRPTQRAPLVRRAADEISRKLNARRQPGRVARQSPGINF